MIELIGPFVIMALFAYPVIIAACILYLIDGGTFR